MDQSNQKSDMTLTLMKPQTKPKIREAWHSLFSHVLEKRYTPFGLTVHSHFRLMSEPPEADVALIRKEGSWTEEQYNVLPDGIRQTKALCYLLEFKMTESLNKRRIEQALLYHIAYKRTQNLTNTEVQTFLISSKSTHKKRLAEWGYEPTELPGVYHNSLWILRPVKILLLNELSPEPHNAFIKCFASRETEQRKAFTTVYQQLGNDPSENELYWLMVGLWHKFFEGEKMDDLITTEDVLEMSKKRILKTMPLPEILSYYKPEERLAGLSPEERLVGLSPDQIRAYLKQLELESS